MILSFYTILFYEIKFNEEFFFLDFLLNSIFLVIIISFNILTFCTPFI